MGVLLLARNWYLEYRSKKAALKATKQRAKLMEELEHQMKLRDVMFTESKRAGIDALSIDSLRYIVSMGKYQMYKDLKNKQIKKTK